MSDDPGGLAVAAAARLRHMSPGALARLRRMPDDGAAPEFLRLGVPDRPDWVSIVRILAILTDRGAPENRAVLHDAARPWGQVLCDGGDPRWRGEPHDRPLLSEQRLAQLLAARGNARRVLMTRAARAVAARHGPGLQANVADIAWSILAPDNAAILAKPYYRRFDGAGRGPETETDPHA